MGAPRSNSPNTIPPRFIDEEKRAPQKFHLNVNLALSMQDEEIQKSTNRLEEIDSTDTSDLKDELLTLLSASNGCTEDKNIADIISKLSERNPRRKGFSELNCFPGEYHVLTIPHYPGRIKTTDERVVQYSLGRLSFDIFQPKELICTVKSVRNSVQLQQNAPKVMSGGNAAVFSYHIICELIIHTTDGDLEATLINKGFCRESEDRERRVKVTFTGGTLVPSYVTCDNDVMFSLWKKTFANAYENANKERTILGWIYLFCLKLFLGLVLPTDSQNLGSSRHENAFHFEINRPPKGFIDVLYLDSDMRITKGNRGTITVALNR